MLFIFNFNKEKRELKKTYSNLTQVNIDEQVKLWNERGKGYYGEYLLFANLYKHIPGTCKLMMNLHIPTSNGRTTEIDAIMIHETGIYVFEIKHYKGTIYGKNTDNKWTQYFRTAPNNYFLNPIKQNQYHIDALQKLYPGIKMYSYVVFTNPECDLRIKNNNPNLTICKMENLFLELRKNVKTTPMLDIEEIDEIFTELIPYSPIEQEFTTKEISHAEEVSINKYINFAMKEIDDYKLELKNNYRNTIIIMAIIILFLLIF